MNKFHELAKQNGWWSDADLGTPIPVRERWKLIPEKLALIHSEVSEALECYREGQVSLRFQLPNGSTVNKEMGSNGGKPVGFPSELADVVIRCYDLAGALGIDLAEMIEIKHAYNETRSYRHGGKRA